MAAPVPYMRWCRRRYGELFTFRSPLFGLEAIAGTPELAAEIFRASPDDARAGEINAVMEPILGERSLLLLDVDEHLRMRKLLLPPFHGEAIRRYEQLIREIAIEDVESWPTGIALRSRDHTQAITLEVILRAVFGIEEVERLQALRAIIPRALDVNPLLVFTPQLQIDLGRRSPWGRFKRAREAMDAILYDEIRRRRSAADAGAEQRDDILSLLLAATDEQGEPLTEKELRDELVTLLFAGHETTATALAWACERRSRQPRAQQELRGRIADGDDAYLDAAVKELLRIRPVVPVVARRLKKDFELGGYALPAGVAVDVDMSLIQSSPDLYPDPERFDPTRFLGDRQPPYAWLPFGGGTRRCIGAAFAQLEIKIVLAEILSRYQLTPSRRRAERRVIRAVTLAPSRGGEVIASRIRAPARKSETALGRDQDALAQNGARAAPRAERDRATAEQL
jgi:cytochrome P450